MKNKTVLKYFFQSWGLIFLAAFSDTFSAMIIKWRFNQLGDIDYSSFTLLTDYIFHYMQSPIVVIAFVLFSLAPILWFIALNRIQLSIGYPVLISLHLFFVILFSVTLLGEQIEPHKFGGIVCILGSLYFFSRS